MSGILLDNDTWSGVKETYAKDHNTGKFAVKREQDVSGILSANTAEQNAVGNGTWKGDMHKVASIPWVIAEEWQKELKALGRSNTSPFANENRAFLIGKLNDYNYSKLRTKTGRL